MDWNRRGDKNYMIKIKNIYPYKELKRNDGKVRTYETEGGKKLASVTSIISETQTEEKKQGLENWKKRVGEKEAEKIKNKAALVGTSMHKHLETYLLQEQYIDDTDIGRIARPMANEIIKKGLVDLEELWGSEVHLYYPGLYAGTTDVVGVYKGKPSIVDFKQTNKPKKVEWVGDYKLQLAAYAMAHNILFNTQITKGVIMMCSKDNYYQEFVIEGSEFQKYKHNFLRRVDEYYRTRPKKTG